MCSILSRCLRRIPFGRSTTCWQRRTSATCRTASTRRSTKIPSRIFERGSTHNQIPHGAGEYERIYRCRRDPSEAPSKSTGSAPYTKQQVANGCEVYAKECAVCPGANLQG